VVLSVDTVVAGAGLGAVALAGKGGRRLRGFGPGGERPGGARWATRRDLGPLAIRQPEAGRVVLGTIGRRLVAAEAGCSVLVVGPTQSQKTSGVVIPAILEWAGPVVAASVKADLARCSLAWRRRAGRVWVYDPADVVGSDLAGSGAEPVRWTPVDASGTWIGSRRVAATLVEATRAGGSPMTDGDFWYSSAAKLLAPLLHAAAVSGAGIGDVVRWLDDQQVDEPTEALAAAGAWPALQAARACWGRDQRQRSAVYATAESVLEPYGEFVTVADRAVAGFELPGDPAPAPGSGGRGPIDPTFGDAGPDAGEGNRTFDPSNVIQGSNTLYLCAPAHHQRRLRPLFTTLLTQVLDAAMDKAERTGRPLDPPLLVVVDEAANVAPVADLDVLAATAAGHGVQLLTVWQDLAQVTARYGPSAGTVVNNHRAKLFLSGIADPNTLEHASTLVGETERRQQTTTIDHQGRKSATQVDNRQRLLAPDALRRLRPGQGILVSGHLQPCRLRLRPWFADPDLRAKAGGTSTPVR